jgi:hypothetical protein
MIAAKTFDPSHLSELMTEDRDEAATSTFSNWIQQTATQAQSYQAIGDQLVDTLLKNSAPSDSDKGRDLITKTIGDLLTRACLQENAIGRMGSDQIDLSEHYER